MDIVAQTHSIPNARQPVRRPVPPVDQTRNIRPAALHVVFAATCTLCSPRRRHGSALRRGGAFATESQLSGRLVGGPDGVADGGVCDGVGAWAGTGEGDRGGSRVALRSRRDSRLGSRLVRSCQLSRSKKKAPWA